MSTGNIVGLLMLCGGGAVIFSVMGREVNQPILFLGIGILAVAAYLFIRALKQL